MPYALKKQGSKYCVFNKDTGESKGCSDSREMGLRHMRALYANVGSKDVGCQCDVCLTLDQYDSLEEIKELTPESFLTSIVDRVKEVFTPQPTSSVTFTKDQATGRTRVMMRVSNNFKDRHGEIITEEAHKEYESYVSRTGDYPEFQLWHTRGSRWGQADLVSFDDGFLTVSGLVDEGKEYVAEGLRGQKDLGVSHGFKGWGTGDGLIHWYRMKECSPLPRVEAANLLTSIDILEKGMNDKKKKFFTDLGVPEAVIESWDKENKDLDALAKGAGFEFKDIEGEPPKPEPEPKPEPKPEEAKQVEVEVTLPNGTKTKAMVPAELVQSQPEVADAPEWAKQLIQSNQDLKKELDQLKAAKTVDQWEAAIVNGKGFVASKQGEPPSESETKDNGEWLAQLIVGGSN